jgi:Nif-specific regulatory protein
MPRLHAIAGPLSGALLPLPDGYVSVGRDSSNDLALADSGVGAKHCLFSCREGRVAIRDFDRGNPTFVNGMPATDEPLHNGDQIQIGASVFVLGFETGEGAQPVGITDGAALDRPTIVLEREELFTGSAFHKTAPAARLSRDLAALMRISAAINAVRGLAGLERPLLELVSEVVPASRGAIVRSEEGATDIAAVVGWGRGQGTTAPIEVNRALLERVLRDVVGILTREAANGAGPSAGPRPRPVLAAPLVAFDKVIGAIVLEGDEAGERLDEGHLHLVMAVAGMAATSLEHARQMESLEGANRRLQTEINLDHNMVGDSGPMRQVYKRIARVAPTHSTALITGESGTGKELVARAIHRNSPRADRPFVAINCAAITETLLESELFGHERGAFTGAVVQKKGKLEMAEGGTVFLDEIGELSLALQAKLLRVLQDREFERVGGTKRVRVDFRLIAATNRDLEAAIESGAFRRDLYYRLNVVILTMPPLRERREDIPLLASCFARRHADKAKRYVEGFAPDALACLTAYDWPGNVRELENAIEHAVVLGAERLIVPDDLPDAIVEAGASAPSIVDSSTLRFHEAVKQHKRALILKAVEQGGGNYNAAARLLGLHPNYLHRLIKNLQMKGELNRALDK